MMRPVLISFVSLSHCLKVIDFHQLAVNDVQAHLILRLARSVLQFSNHHWLRKFDLSVGPPKHAPQNQLLSFYLDYSVGSKVSDRKRSHSEGSIFHCTPPAWLKHEFSTKTTVWDTRGHVCLQVQVLLLLNQQRSNGPLDDAFTAQPGHIN
jgi:hypothetical protein